MAIFPERGQDSGSIENVQATPEIPQVSPSMEKAGVVAPPTEFPTPPPENGNNNFLNSIPTTVEVPADPKIIEKWSRGDTKYSLTWLGKLYLKIILIAQKLGWGVKISNANNS